MSTVGGSGIASTRPTSRLVQGPRADEHRVYGPLFTFLLVFAAQFGFGMWMDARGFLWNDALSRATSALTALYSADPHLAAIGFVWMPLPTLLELIPTAFYALWTPVVSSGFASTLITAVAGGGTAVMLLLTSKAFGIPDKFGVAYALLVSTNPMLFLFAGNGMSEGLAAPFMIGTICCLTLFWRTGQRRYVAAASLMLALGFASLYQAVQYGAVAFASLALGILFGGGEIRKLAPQGRWRAVEGLGILFLAPSFYVATLWVGANAIIMGDPLFFAKSAYSNEGVVAATGAGHLAFGYQGDLSGTLLFVAERTAPFFIPVAFLLVVRITDGRLWDVNTLSLLLMALSVPVGMMVPQVYSGASFGWLRYFLYPLFVGAGWGLYEVVSSRRRWVAGSLVLAGWVICAPVTFWAMWNPALGQDEHNEVRALVSDETAAQIGFGNDIDDAAPVADFLNGLPEGKVVALDSVYGWPIVAHASPECLSHKLLLTTDARFRGIVANPRSSSLDYLVVPNPKMSSRDLIVRRYPQLWKGNDSAFKLVKDFPKTSEQWRIYRVR
jgi:hypothetical protein